MNLPTTFLLFIAATSTAAFGADVIGTPALAAHARLAPTHGNAARGLVTMVQRAGNLYIKARIEGLSPGLHGFHIHETGDCRAPDAGSAGKHFNPAAGMQGEALRSEQHGGEFGSLTADEDGVAVLDMLVPVSQVGLQNGAANNVRGRSLVVHAALAGSGAPARLACGVIRDGL